MIFHSNRNFPSNFLSSVFAKSEDESYREHDSSRVSNSQSPDHVKIKFVHKNTCRINLHIQ